MADGKTFERWSDVGGTIVLGDCAEALGGYSLEPGRAEGVRSVRPRARQAGGVDGLGVNRGTRRNSPYFREADSQRTSIDQSLLLAACFRGGVRDDPRWISNADQVVTLSLFYTGDVSYVDCVRRFSRRSRILDLYGVDGELKAEISARYVVLIELVQARLDLIEGGGDFETPADPTFTACRLTDRGLQIASRFTDCFPQKPVFLNWPDRRSPPIVEGGLMS